MNFLDGAPARPLRFGASLFLGLLLALSLATPRGVATGDLLMRPSAAGSFEFNKTETCLMNKVNKIRARHGLRELKNDKQLGQVARRHARRIARAKSLFHLIDIADMTKLVGGWLHLGENTGRAGTCRKMVHLFMGDPIHRANILNPLWKFQGVGTHKGGRRTYYEHLFTDGSNPTN